MKYILATLLSICLLFTSLNAATTYYISVTSVSGSTSSTPPCSVSTKPCSVSGFSSAVSGGKIVFKEDDVILLRAGTYASTTFTGLKGKNGPRSLMLIGTGATTIFPTLAFKSCANLTVQTITINGALSTTAQDGLSVSDSKNMTIFQFDIFNTGKAGVSIKLSPRTLVTGNTITNTTAECIKSAYSTSTGASSGMIWGTDLYDVQLSGNTLQNCGSDGIFCSTADAIIRNNRILKTGTKKTTAVHGINSAGTNAFITDNVITDPLFHGINVNNTALIRRNSISIVGNKRSSSQTKTGGYCIAFISTTPYTKGLVQLDGNSCFKSGPYPLAGIFISTKYGTSAESQGNGYSFNLYDNGVFFNGTALSFANTQLAKVTAVNNVLVLAGAANAGGIVEKTGTNAYITLKETENFIRENAGPNPTNILVSPLTGDLRVISGFTRVTPIPIVGWIYNKPCPVILG